MKLLGEGLLNSYSQIYFSNSRLLAALLLAISFFDLGAGLAGVLAILISQLTAIAYNFNLEQIRNGTYTYNSAMVGVAIGIFYQFNFSLLILLAIASILTFLLSIWFAGHFLKKGLPFLSIPFLLVIWLVILGGKNFSALELHQKDTLSMAKFFPEMFIQTTDFISGLPFNNLLHLYFRSLGAILFQYYDLAGIIICIGILIFSRISFLLSIYGFALGFMFYRYMEADFTQLVYSYIGFNFILTSIALGGFFIVASRRSFLLLLFSIPIIAIIISGLHGLFGFFGLPLYSLPFNIVVLLILYVVLNREYASNLHLVAYQHFSPEKNHYKFFNSRHRFSHESYFHVRLPFIGQWHVSQGHSGKVTHKDDYKYAWDFDIRDDDNKTFKDPGLALEDYYCYGLPVVAPSDGYVVAVTDNIEDNKIGEVDLKNNWGNTIIIKHGDYLYSKLSHLKKGGMQVSVGDAVSKGKVIAYCGSSGRSPEPHLHFQLQATPFIGSKTLPYPISYYLTKSRNGYSFYNFKIPGEGEVVQNVNTNKVLTDSYNFIPGKILEWQYVIDGKTENCKWEVFTNSLNRSYVFCHKTKSLAWFVNNGTVFYFTDFSGKKNSLLHRFFKGSFKVLLGFYEGIIIKDLLPVEELFPSSIKALHDITAPFGHYLKADYNFSFTRADSSHNPSKISFDSNCKGCVSGREIITENYSVELGSDNFKSFTFFHKGKKTVATCISG